MDTTPVTLQAVDRLEITVLVDNSIDVFLPGTEAVQRASLSTELPWGERHALIAEHGYAALPGEGLRFFPLLPLLGRWLAPLVGGSPGVALLAMSNGSALAFGALLYHLAVRETGDHALARRAVWLAALAAPAYVLVMGYAEAPALALAVAMFLALRSRRWALVSLAGLVAGFLRPLAVLLAVPAAVEVLRTARTGRRTSWSERLAQLGAIVAPVVGAATFMAWVGARFGDPLLPVRIQAQNDLHGTPVNPVTLIARAARALFSGRSILEGLHLPWLLLAVVLVVVSARRWPACYAALGVATLLATMTGRVLSSFERYAFSAFPLILAAASLIRRTWTERVVLALSAATMVVYALLTFLGRVVP
jgi:hypothetical protein